MRSQSETNSRADILIVDDQPDNLRLLATMLADQGFKVRKALNGEMALTAVSKADLDLILLDIMMPDLDGYTVCQKLKENPATKSIPIIFLSALDEPLDKVKAFQVGAVDYISKPFQLEEVIVRIEHQLTIQQQRRELAYKNEQLQKEIIEHQSTAEILYQSRALLASVLNSSLDGVAAMQAIRTTINGRIKDFRCLLVNPVAAKLVGRQREDLIGKELLRRLLRKIDTGLFASFVKVVETGKNIDRELCYERENRKIWYHFVAVKLGDGFAVTFRDITEQKELVLSLQAANGELERLSTMDGLTQVANRRRFDDYLLQEWANLAQEKRPLAIIMCDLDYFKLFNDTYGHARGDDCLRDVARTIARNCKRPGDLVARYGGEEFVALLPNADEDWAVQVAELVRISVEQLAISHSASKVSDRVTVSLGVTSVFPSPSISLEAALELADRALYEAKNQGRNRAILLSPPANKDIATLIPPSKKQDKGDENH